MVRLLQRRPASAPEAVRQVAIIDGGTYELKKDMEEKVELSLCFEDRDPWPVYADRPYKSNVRILAQTFVRMPGATRPCRTLPPEELLPWVNPSDKSRRELRFNAPGGFGKVYLHVLAWWLFKGKPSNMFNRDWDTFRASGQHVDHGWQGSPHIVDLRKLTLKPGSGKGSNPSQGASIRWGHYHPRGGLHGVMYPPKVKRRPAGKFAKSVVKKRPCR